MNLRRAKWCLVVGLSTMGLVACPPASQESDAGTDAFERVRRDVGPIDAFVELDALELDAFMRPPDAGPFDAGPIPQCEGLPVPGMICASDPECVEAGFARCALPTVVGVCPRCGFIMDECMVDDDCLPRDAGPMVEAMFPDANEDAAAEDAGPAEDAGARDAGMDGGRADVGPVPLVCVTYDRACACPRRVCEPRCTGPTCPDARCDRDGYVCPQNSVCAPTETVTDDHGCAPKRCVTNADCDCGWCAPGGLCANGAGTCVI